jgi:N-sulfoglucosamine sulfohydrolase
MRMLKILLINAFGKRPQFELYDIVNDPGETKNLAYEQKYWEILEDLKLQWKEYRSDTDDPWRLKWAHD